MNIKLLMDLPLPDKHGMKKDKVLEVATFIPNVGKSSVRYWVVSDANEKVGVLGYEAEEVKNEGTELSDSLQTKGGETAPIDGSG